VRMSEKAAYRVSYQSEPARIPVNQMHSWTLHVETAAGQPVTDATVKVDGDMPQHGHGLPTRPRVTRNLGNGDYLVEGMKFQMGGWWVVDFTIDAAGQRDTVRFNLILK
jgi:YtkA-like protein